MRRPDLGVEDAGVGEVEELAWAGPFAELVAGGLSDEGEDVGAYVPAAEGVETPEIIWLVEIRTDFAGKGWLTSLPQQ